MKKISIYNKNKKDVYKDNIKLEKKYKNFKKNKNFKFKDLKFISNLSMNIIIKLGYANITIKELLKLSKGSIIFFSKKSKDLLSIFVNNCLVAKGKIIFKKNRYGVKILNLIKNSFKKK
ncbi:FliM/FliN family flagellar motor switch protein [Buchnera aphidicola]|uniref:FliM/FliN family flagellar motor switch protein n=1 Tax=Buchnera aphidicola TaxID=9 RepID=UPI0030EB21D4